MNLVYLLSLCTCTVLLIKLSGEPSVGQLIALASALAHSYTVAGRYSYIAGRGQKGCKSEMRAM